MAIILGPTSQRHLETCDPRLQDLIWRAAAEAPKHLDFSVLCGHRGKAEQEEAYRTGRSTTQWPHSKHNRTPAIAVDIAPYPIDWNDAWRFARLMGFVENVALRMQLAIRFGHDWDGDGRIAEERFRDWPHLELIE
jgi:peptidoglycan L-alanyl-D-glutamate endopeptidase CwlK